MKRSKVDALFKYLEYLVVEDNALIELLTTVNHTMTNSINLAEIFDNANLWVGEQREDKLNTLCMLWYVVHYLLLLAVCELNLYERAVETYTLSAA